MLGCDPCEGRGKIVNPTTGNLNKCQRCKGEGRKLVAHTRVTTFIDVLEDKSNLMAWKARQVLRGVAIDPKLINGVIDLDQSIKADKDALNRRAESAATVAGADDKATMGTFKHGLTELVDEGKELPATVDFGDVVDMHEWRRLTKPFKHVRMEKLVVNRQYKCAGTPDRTSVWIGDEPLVAPDGTEFGPEDELIVDLKTGTTEYGQLKMAMQLAIYANSDLYDHTSFLFTPQPRVSKKWGLIVNVPAGTGTGRLLWADLELGWRAVDLASKVRTIRNEGRKALLPASFVA